MPLIIAYCTNAEVFNCNRILNENVAKYYPGALWVTTLSVITNKKGIKVVTGDYALEKIKDKTYHPSDILVIQEDCCALGQKIIKMGAKPFLLICAESTLYANEFYSNLFFLSSIFRNRVLFRGVFNETSEKGTNHVLYFPSFKSLNLKSSILNNKWSARSFIVMVAANKYWGTNKRSFISKLASICRDLLKHNKIIKKNNPKEIQLHDKRLELIEFFGKTSNFTLYGNGWSNIDNLNEAWNFRLKPIIDKLNPLPCSDKHTTISKYKFAICLENIIFPGYVTEKIFDCFKSGVIPIYLGAPDILDFVPGSIFIDLREFSSNEKLYYYLQNLTEKKAEQMVIEAHKFLKSRDGKRFSYEFLAKKVMNMVDTFEK